MRTQTVADANKQNPYACRVHNINYNTERAAADFDSIVGSSFPDDPVKKKCVNPTRDRLINGEGGGGGEGWAETARWRTRNGGVTSLAFPGRILIFVSRQTEQSTCDVIRPNEIVSNSHSKDQKRKSGVGKV